VVIVDEVGTEAAATTVMMMTRGLVVEKTVTFNANHSFIYYIRHQPTNTILFVGDYHGN
jgi:serpin B